MITEVYNQEDGIVLDVTPKPAPKILARLEEYFATLPARYPRDILPTFKNGMHRAPDGILIRVHRL